MKEFNVTGVCMPEENYMVDITEKLKQIRAMVNRKQYFTINRGRQYGKTTTLVHLKKFLADDYQVISLNFQGFGEEEFQNSEAFCQEFLTSITHYLDMVDCPEDWTNPAVKTFSQLSRHLTKMCKGKKVVLLIDEVDAASNHRVFLYFLGLLRTKFLSRQAGTDFTFHSVILAGVYDIKNIKRKMIQEGNHQLSSGEKQLNSPWNIAADFKVDMSFSIQEIEGMLREYEADHQLEIDSEAMAREIHSYTNGYPVLVSKICWYLDTILKTWMVQSVGEAVRLVVRETDNEIFKSLSQNLENNDGVRDLLYEVLILGEKRAFSTVNPSVDLAYRYNYIEENTGRVKISNKIFEMAMTQYFISKDEENGIAPAGAGYIAEITRHGTFNMELCLERFLVHWHEIYAEKDADFLERQCRIIFLTYLRPILNGVGFSFIETAFTDDRRMDLVVVYNKQRFVLELKIWKGALYNEQGVNQLLGYMEKLGEKDGYLLTFDFRKNPEPSLPAWRQVGESRVFEARICG